MFCYDFGERRAVQADLQRKLPRGWVSALTSAGNTVVVTYDNGTLAGIDSGTKRVAWVNDYIPKNG